MRPFATDSPRPATPAFVLAWPVLFALAALLAQALPAVVDTLAAAVPAVLDTVAVGLNPAPDSVTYPALLSTFGLHVGRLIAGFLGGFVRMRFAAKAGSTYRDWLVRCIVGAVVGNYAPDLAGFLAPPLASLVVTTALPLAFILSYGAETYLPRWIAKASGTPPTSGTAPAGDGATDGDGSSL